MGAKEIKELRQSGKLDEALVLALAEYQQAPDSIWGRRNLCWVYYDYAKFDFLSSKFDAFFTNIQAISDLNMPEDEKILFDSIGWLIVKFGNALMKEKIIDIVKIDKLLLFEKKFHFTKPSDVYSSLFKLFHKAYKNTDKYLNFADDWGRTDFRPEDFEEEVWDNGKTSMSLVESAYITYAKHLLPKQTAIGDEIFDKKKAESFVLMLDKIGMSHPEYQYPSYYKVKLLLALGRKEDLQTSFIPFAKMKRNDFWVWEVLSEIFSMDKEKVFVCYCRGLLCVSPEKMTINLRAKIVPLLIQQQMWNEARTEIEKIVEIRNKNNWGIPKNILSYSEEGWYQSAVKKQDNKSLYKQYLPSADAILFGDIAEENIIVEYVNSDKKILNFISSNSKFGFFKYDRFLKSVNIGEVFRVRFLKKEIQGLCQIATVSKTDDTDLKNEYLKEFAGCIRIKEQSTFGFVDDIFIAPFICEKKRLVDNQYIDGKAIKSYNDKKKQWGWKAFHITTQ